MASFLSRLLQGLSTLSSAPSSALTPEADTWLTRSNEEFNEKQEALHDTWCFANLAGYTFDQDSGVLSLTYRDGRTARASGAIVGSFDRHSKTWEWAWNNPHVPLEQLTVSKQAQALGATLGLDYCTQGIVSCKDNVWAAFLAGIGLRASDGQGIFFATVGPITAHIILRDLRWETGAA